MRAIIETYLYGGEYEIYDLLKQNLYLPVVHTTYLYGYINYSYICTSKLGNDIARIKLYKVNLCIYSHISR